MKKRLGVGIDLFSVLRENNCYYVDKTDFIRQVAENMGSVLLYTRPRRFGKTLAMSTLKEFFRIGTDPSLFEGLQIAEDKAFCEKHFGKYPVIFVSLKGVDGLTYESAFHSFQTVIGSEADHFSFLAESDRLSEEDKTDYRALIERDETKKAIYCILRRPSVIDALANGHGAFLKRPAGGARRPVKSIGFCSISCLYAM